MRQVLYGYCRVSSLDQNEDRQRIMLAEKRVPAKNVYVDKRSGKDLMGTFLSDIVLQVLSFAAENERANIRQRQAEGIAAVKARGVKFGRPSVSLPDNFYPVYGKWKNREISVTEAARLCGMTRSTFHERARRIEKNTGPNDL